MKHHLRLVNVSRAGDESTLRNVSRRRAVAWWALSYCLMVAVGCGSASGPEVASYSTKSSTNEEQSPLQAGNSPTQAEAEPRKKIDVAPPTAQQIELWTPAPFERVQLLAIREWEKTSFTGSIAATPDGQHFLVAGSRVVLWSVTKEEPEHVFLELTPEDQERSIRSLAVAPDGKWFAVGDSKGMVRIWNLEDRKEVVAKKLDSTGIQLAISPDSQEIATISYDKEVTIWSAALEQQNKFKVNTNGLKRIEYSAPKSLAAAGESTSLWNTGTGKVVQELSPGRYSFALARSPDATRFLFGSKESLRIWNIADAKQEAAITHGVSGSELLAFSPDGKFLATTDGRSVQLWNLAERRTAQVIDGFGWPIVGVSWLPKTNLLAVASDIGCTRIWGTASQGESLGLKPLHAAVPLPPADSTAPATPAQREQVIDLRTFPRLPGSKPTIVRQGDLQCETSATISEANSFYQYFLVKEGWTAVGASANPAALEYRKNGFMLSVHCYAAGDGKINVSVNHAGNYDLRRTPKFDAAPIETVYEAENTVIYRTKADLLQIETSLLRKLHAAGWTAYSRLHSSHGEQPDQRDLEFLRNGNTLRVFINKYPADPASYNIQYSLFPNNASVPIPPDAGFAEFDGSTKPSLVATTKLTLDQAREFYDKELSSSSQGWLIRELGRKSQDDHCWLSYLSGQSDLSIGLTKLPDGRTLIRVGDARGSLWDASQKKEEPAGEKDAAGLEAADFPVLKASHIKFDDLDKSIEVTVEKSTLAAAAEQFTKSLGMLDWKPEAGGSRDEEYTLIRFRKGKKEITLRARSKDGNAMVSFEGDGLVWNKELPTGKKIVSYETWLRQNKQPAGLELLDRYEAEMRAINKK